MFLLEKLTQLLTYKKCVEIVIIIIKSGSEVIWDVGSEKICGEGCAIVES